MSRATDKAGCKSEWRRLGGKHPYGRKAVRNWQAKSQARKRDKGRA
jgi:hypothetical protein